MQPRIENLQKKKLVGQRLLMSFTNNRTGELWRNFMPRRKEITNAVTTDLCSLQIYSPSHFEHFDPANEFEKWALVEVTDFDDIPAGMDAFTLAGGLYAVFLHKGSSTDTSTFQYIFTNWLPNSNYLLDDRPHFERLGEKYINGAAGSEEEIWIPIKPKE